MGTQWESWGTIVCFKIVIVKQIVLMPLEIAAQCKVDNLCNCYVQEFIVSIITLDDG